MAQAAASKRNTGRSAVPAMLALAEGVIWLVMKATTSASSEQIAALADALHGPNNRPVQPRNARVVLR